MLIPLEAEVESFHTSAAAFLRPQSSSLRDQQHPAGSALQYAINLARGREHIFQQPANTTTLGYC